MAVPFILRPSPRFWENVQKRVSRNQDLPRNIFPHGPLIGSIGEIAFKEWFSTTFPRRGIRHAGEVSHDYEIAGTGDDPAGARRLTLEVKTKARTPAAITAKGTARWEMSVPGYLLHHLDEVKTHPDILFGVSVQTRSKQPAGIEDIDTIAILGWIEFERFAKIKYLVPADTPMGHGTTKNPVEMWNIAIGSLNDAGTL
jgi:hypothetical protein